MKPKIALRANEENETYLCFASHALCETYDAPASYLWRETYCFYASQLFFETYEIRASHRHDETYAYLASHFGIETYGPVATTKTKGVITMTKKELKKKYDTRSITEIENEIKENHQLVNEAKKEFFHALLYLRNSGRYKENPLYKKSSFEKYLMGQFNMRLNTFLSSARAYDKYPTETSKYGVGLISKIHNVCGVVKEKKVIDEIKTVDKSSKKPVNQVAIEKIIQKHAKPLKRPKIKVDYKTLYLEEQRQHEAIKEKYHDVISQLEAANERIEKLKETIINLKLYFTDDVEEKESVPA